MRHCSAVSPTAAVRRASGVDRARGVLTVLRLFADGVLHHRARPLTNCGGRRAESSSAADDDQGDQGECRSLGAAPTWIRPLCAHS